MKETQQGNVILLCNINTIWQTYIVTENFQYEIIMQYLSKSFNKQLLKILNINKTAQEEFVIFEWLLRVA